MLGTALHTAPKRHCRVGGPVLAFGFKDGLRLPPPPPTALSLVRPGGSVSQGSGPQPAPSRDRQQCPYQALL